MAFDTRVTDRLPCGPYLSVGGGRMGKKGGTRTGAAKHAADDVVATLDALGGVTSRGMFGGYGIFVDGVMFGLVDRSGEVHLRVDSETQGRYQEAGGLPHGKMPYFSVPEFVRRDPDTLRAWAEDAAAVARAAKK